MSIALYRLTWTTTAIIIGSVFLLVSPAWAQGTVPDGSDVYRVTNLEGNQNFNDFVVGPGKFEFSVAPGESTQAVITVTNRSGERKLFRITTEDMRGSDDPSESSVLLGDDVGPYTLKDLLQVAAPEFYLDSGQRATVPITVSLPVDAPPGGRYGSLLVETASAGNSNSNVPTAAIVSRIAVLFFVTTPGELERSGELVAFDTVPDKAHFSRGPINFGLLYENTGTVHVNPSGVINIYNLFGTEVGSIPVAAWFSLPESSRLREVQWDRELLLGRYTAVADINRGYGDIIDTRSTTFWVVDWVVIAVVGGTVFMLLFITRFIGRRFVIAKRPNS